MIDHVNEVLNPSVSLPGNIAVACLSVHPASFMQESSFLILLVL